MKLRELLQDVAAAAMTADPETEIGGVSYDSRTVRPGDLFVAISGYECDGHRFIPAAAAAGAAAVVCETPPEGDVPYVQVKNSREALALVSAAWFGYPARALRVIGVTGTSGKTTTTVLLKQVLEKSLGAKVGLIGTNANVIGEQEEPSERSTPESYQLQKLFRRMADAGCTYVVMEVTSHALVLDRVAGIRFAAAVYTNLSQDHLDFHGTMEAYAEAKSRLFSRCDRAVINLDDGWSRFMTDHADCPVLTCSIDRNEADLVAKDVKLLPDRVKFCAVTIGDIQRVELKIPGRFSVYNALSVLGCAMSLGVPLESAAAALAGAHGVKGRVESVPTDGDYTILIDYSHKPDALDNVLRTVRESAPGRVVAVFGCGGDRDRTKRPVMGKIATELADFTIVTSDNPRTEDPEEIIREIAAGCTGGKKRFITITDRVQAIEYAIENHRPGDVIVLAGKGHETYQEINHVKHHLDEREVVAEILERRRNRK